jgi:hypothetical protein
MKKNNLFLVFFVLVSIKNSVHAGSLEREDQTDKLFPSQSGNIISLPNELIQKILEYLDMSSLINVVTQNKKLGENVSCVLKKRFTSFDQVKFETLKKLTAKQQEVFFEHANCFPWHHRIWAISEENDAFFFVLHFEKLTEKNGNLPSWTDTSFWSTVSQELFQVFEHVKNHKKEIFEDLIPKEPLPYLSNESFWKNAPKELFKFLILLQGQPTLFNLISPEKVCFKTFWNKLGNLRPELSPLQPLLPKIAPKFILSQLSSDLLQRRKKRKIDEISQSSRDLKIQKLTFSPR